MQVVVNDDDFERCSWHRDNLQDTGLKRFVNKKPYLASMGWILYLKGRPKLVRLSNTGIPIQGAYTAIKPSPCFLTVLIS